jgi:hypothetical protein
MDLDRPALNTLIMNAAFQMATEGVPAATARQLDDQNPVIPLAIDVDGDVALATLLSWSEQDSGYEPSLCNAILVQRDDGWCPTGLSAGLPPCDYPLTARRPASTPGLHIRLYERDGEEPGPEAPRSRKPWLAAALLVTAEVEALRVGDRPRTVPFHGYVPIAARNPAEAVVTAIGDDGSVLETIDLRRDSSELFRELRHREPHAWPFKIDHP